VTNVTTEERCWWSINVTGYGRFSYFGNDAEAEEMRKDKAEWEGGTGTKRKATLAEAEDGVNNLKWRRDFGYGMDERELIALKGVS
jgi:hypothetical protein